MAQLNDLLVLSTANFIDDITAKSNLVVNGFLGVASGLGVGTTTTNGYKLYVNGTSYFNNDVKVNGFLGVASGLCIGATATNGYKLYVDGTSCFTGALKFANTTWNDVGDDCALGDCDQAGVIGIKGLNGATGIYFVPYSGSVAQKITIDGAGTMSITGKISADTLQTIQNNVASTISSANSDWLHYQTNAPNGHWFNKNVSVQGNIYAGTGYSDLVLTSANYTDYAPTKTGSGASGTWDINITGSASRVAHMDTRQLNQSPNDVQAGLTVHLKSNGVDGLSDGGNYHGVLSIKEWSDISGGPYWQATVTQNGNLHFRASKDGNTWGNWRKVIDSENYTGLNTVYARLRQGNDFIHDTNEVTLVPNGYKGCVWINYRTQRTATSDGCNGDITEYRFGNGKGSTNGVTLYADAFDGTANQASKLTDISANDAASSTATWRRLWFSWDDNTTGRPAYDDRFAIQTSTGTLKATNIITDSLSFNNTNGAFKGIYGTCYSNDYWRIGGGASGSDQGYLEIATADNGDEPIYVRQYSYASGNSSNFATITRTLTLLDKNGDTNIPGKIKLSSSTILFKDTTNSALIINGTGSTPALKNLWLLGDTSIANTLSIGTSRGGGHKLYVTGGSSLFNGSVYVKNRLWLGAESKTACQFYVHGLSIFNNGIVLKENITYGAKDPQNTSAVKEAGSIYFKII